MMIKFNNIRQCGRICHCVEYLDFKRNKNLQFYIKCYNKLISKDKIYYKFKRKTNKIKTIKL